MAAKTATKSESSDGGLAATYTLVYSFLTARSHEKAAAAVKKAAKDIVVLKDNVTVDETPLDEIVKWWKAKKEADAKTHSPESSSESSSDSDASSVVSDSDSSNSGSSSDSDSSTDSSSSDKPQVLKRGLDSPDAAKPAEANGKAVASHAVVSTHKPKSRALQDATQHKPNNLIPRKAENAKAPISSRSSSSDSDTSSSESREKLIKTGQTAAQSQQNVEATVVTNVSNPTTVRAAKKRRTSTSGNAVPTAIAAETSSPGPNQNGKRPHKSNTPFQRIKADAVEFHDDRLKDNGFVAKGGSANDYGARANQDLIVTRGDSFRKEKNKKKRGSYRGGEITMESHSIKFT